MSRLKERAAEVATAVSDFGTELSHAATALRSGEAMSSLPSLPSWLVSLSSSSGAKLLQLGALCAAALLCLICCCCICCRRSKQVVNVRRGGANRLRRAGFVEVDTREEV